MKQANTMENILNTTRNKAQFGTTSRLINETAFATELNFHPHLFMHGSNWLFSSNSKNMRAINNYHIRNRNQIKSFKLIIQSSLIRYCILLSIVLSAPYLVFAHTVNLALEKAPTHDVVLFYLKLGIAHIVPMGIDHILFVIALCLLNNKLKTILWQATAFTVAHSITLALSMKSIVTLPSAIVEPLIALSIVFVAVENILISELKVWRILIVFLFGLIHGLGFAAALNEIGLPRNKFFTSIISFNAGVEIGQILVILFVYLLIIFPLCNKIWYKKGVVYPISMLIASIGVYWTFLRLM